MPTYHKQIKIYFQKLEVYYIALDYSTPIDNKICRLETSQFL